MLTIFASTFLTAARQDPRQNARSRGDRLSVAPQKRRNPFEKVRSGLLELRPRKTR